MSSYIVTERVVTIDATELYIFNSDLYLPEHDKYILDE